MKRYDQNILDCYDRVMESADVMIEDENGKFVRYEEAAAEIDRLTAERENAITLLERVYHAVEKPDWAEGECWNEVALDVRFAIDDVRGDGYLAMKERER